ncbi:MAG TPA: flavodoxin family protein [Desulfuromonadaceae bacterium]
MSKVVIVYHSTYGHTEAQAKAVLQGVQRVEVAAGLLLHVTEVEKHWDDLNGADAIIFGCPTYMGSASADFKRFMEASSKLWSEQKWKDKLAAGFTNSGSQSGDKLNTLVQLAVFAAQHGMIWVSLGMLPGNNTSSGGPADVNRLGSYLGAMAQSNIDMGSDAVPPRSDRETAASLGQRVTEICRRFVPH